MMQNWTKKITTKMKMKNNNIINGNAYVEKLS